MNKKKRSEATVLSASNWSPATAETMIPGLVEPPGLVIEEFERSTKAVITADPKNIKIKTSFTFFV